MSATKRRLQSKGSASTPARATGHEVGEGLLDEGDISLIRSMLARSPTERLERLQDFADGIMALRNGRVDPE